MTKLKDMSAEQISRLKYNTEKFCDLEQWEQDAMSEACDLDMLEYRMGKHWFNKNGCACHDSGVYRLKKIYPQPEEPYVYYALCNSEGGYLRLRNDFYCYHTDLLSNAKAFPTMSDALRFKTKHAGSQERHGECLYDMRVVKLSIAVCEREAHEKFNDRLDEVEREFNDKIEKLGSEIAKRMNDLRK